LRTQVVNLIWLDFVEDAGQVRRVGEVALVELGASIVDVEILVNVIDPLSVEE
jgi:hypothetical protein